MSDLESSLIGFCAAAGADPLLVQGAGGNVSWKENGVLRVKASGTWLADAATRDIFVGVDLAALQGAIDRRDYAVVSTAVSGAGLRPSIETLLHAVMPHTVVVHLHAVEILAHLVRRDGEHDIDRRLGRALHWAMVGYFKPGAELAGAVGQVVDREGDVKVVLLKNHGVVIGGSDVGEIRSTLGVLTDRLREPVRADLLPPRPFGSTPYCSASAGYVPVDDPQLHCLATDGTLFDRLAADWVLYPDHVVFLGPRAHCYDSVGELQSALAGVAELPEPVFVRGVGVFVTRAFGKARSAQLRCYFDVLVRQPEGAILAPLPEAQIADLLGRDDEKHRMRSSGG